MGSARIKIERALAKYLVNPVMRAMLLTGVAPRAFALLETTGRRTGKRRRTPVGNGLDGDVFWVVSEHGERCAYVRNLVADPHVRVKVGRRWRTGRASLLADDDGLARRHELDCRNGLAGRVDGAIFRTLASEVATVRIELD
jgi:deazaflavin-dependent oxidoreductase (nitroreductase family)